MTMGVEIVTAPAPSRPQQGTGSDDVEVTNLDALQIVETTSSTSTVRIANNRNNLNEFDPSSTFNCFTEMFTFMGQRQDDEEEEEVVKEEATAKTSNSSEGSSRNPAPTNKDDDRTDISSIDDSSTIPSVIGTEKHALGHAVVSAPSSTSVGNHKNIVICCDGTGCDLEGSGTNVLRLFRALCKDDEQLTYYDSGVGTLNNPGQTTDLERAIGRRMDKAFGYSVEFQVCRAYRWLVQNYKAGDTIYLFGFSRGAYSIRALAGLIYQVGLVLPQHEHLTELGWSHYADAELQACEKFKRIFSRRGLDGEEDVPIHFVGAWDTVSSFGRMTDFKTLPNTASNPLIRHIRHAVAIDEKRACFQPSLFQSSDLHESFLEYWFAGVHGDVGGGYSEDCSGLSKIALLWMFDEAEACGCKFSRPSVSHFLGETSRCDDDEYQVAPNHLAPTNKSLKGFLWNTLEYIPRKYHCQSKGSSTWHGPNLYRSRKIPADAMFHESVRNKLKNDHSYRPKNLPDKFRRSLSRFDDHSSSKSVAGVVDSKRQQSSPTSKAPRKRMMRKNTRRAKKLQAVLGLPEV